MKALEDQEFTWKEIGRKEASLSFDEEIYRMKEQLYLLQQQQQRQKYSVPTQEMGIQCEELVDFIPLVKELKQAKEDFNQSYQRDQNHLQKEVQEWSAKLEKALQEIESLQSSNRLQRQEIQEHDYQLTQERDQVIQLNKEKEQLHQELYREKQTIDQLQHENHGLKEEIAGFEKLKSLWVQREEENQITMTRLRDDVLAMKNRWDESHHEETAWELKLEGLKVDHDTEIQRYITKIEDLEKNQEFLYRQFHLLRIQSVGDLTSQREKGNESINGKGDRYANEHDHESSKTILRSSSEEPLHISHLSHEESEISSNLGSLNAVLHRLSIIEQFLSQKEFLFGR